MSDKDYIYKGFLRIFRRVRNDRNYEILEAPDAVAALLIDDRERILLVEQYRPALDTMTWEIPAGCLDKPGFTPVQVLVEEIQEECGISLLAEALEPILSYVPQIGHNSSTMQIFMARLEAEADQTRPINDVDVQRIRWWPLAEVREAIETGRILDEKTMLAYFFYLQRKRA